MRIFYWAAYNGYKKYVRLMIVKLRWSPFMKAYRNRSIVSGAIWGSQVDTIRLILGEFRYDFGSAEHSLKLTDLLKEAFNKDIVDNNCLHYSYMIDLPEVRQLLRENGYYDNRS